MEFGLSDEQLVLQETARRFAHEEIAPVAAKYDASGEFPREIIAKAYDGFGHAARAPERGHVAGGAAQRVHRPPLGGFRGCVPRSPVDSASCGPIR